ncbi:hypothetical protein MMC30_000226 [Trapelia coarctata]|nr:hypothetical protein [Trapelia coarctata]
MDDRSEKTSIEQLRDTVEALARQYLASYPGEDRHADNKDHQHLRDLLEGGYHGYHKLTYLNEVLKYRISAMKLATEYKDFLQLQFPACDSFDAFGWLSDHVSNIRQEGRAGLSAAAKVGRYMAIRDFVTSAFRRAQQGQGYTYRKPRDYLAMALASSELSLEQARRALDDLKFEITLTIGCG